MHIKTLNAYLASRKSNVDIIIINSGILLRVNSRESIPHVRSIIYVFRM